MPSKDLYEAAASYEGTPFGHRGRQPGRRLDCAGVVVCALREVGERPIDVVEYSRTGLGTALLKTIASQCDKVDETCSGCIGVFFYERRKVSQHCGIFGDGTLVHSWADAGRVVIDHWPNTFWTKRLLGIYKYRK